MDSRDEPEISEMDIKENNLRDQKVTYTVADCMNSHTGVLGPNEELFNLLAESLILTLMRMLALLEIVRTFDVSTR